MKTIKGPAVFLAQFAGDESPFDTLEHLARWAADLGYKALRILSWDARLFDLELAATSRTYCDEIRAMLQQHGLVISELSTHLQGQLVATHPAYDELFDSFAPTALHGKPQARQQWAVKQLLLAAKASANLQLTAHATFSGALVWHLVYPWPQRPTELIDAAFAELARRWRPILDAFDAAGVDVCYEIHPGEDLHDGASFERFLAAVDHHPRASILFDPSYFLLQQLDYLAFIELYHERIKAIFSKLAQYDYPGWAVIEWECCLKHPEDGAREGAAFIRDHIIRVTERAFDDFAGASTDVARNCRLLGL